MALFINLKIDNNEKWKIGRQTWIVWTRVMARIIKRRMNVALC